MAKEDFANVLFVVCKVLNHFVDEKLVTKDALGKLKPVDGAADITIAKELRAIAANDEKDGTHSIQFIRLNILDGVQNLGFGTSLSPAQLANGDFDTIGDLVQRLLDSSFDL